jgi:hypothetical protein
MTKYQYKIITAKEVKETDNGRNILWDISEKEPTEWKFVATLPPNAMLFEKVIQEPEHTFTVPNSTGTYSEPQPNTGSPVVLN